MTYLKLYVFHAYKQRQCQSSENVSTPPVHAPHFTPILCGEWFVAMKWTSLFMVEQSKQCLNAK